MLDYLELVNKFQTISNIEIDYYNLFLEGAKIGLILSFSVGFLAIGLNYCLKLFTKM